MGRNAGRIILTVLLGLIAAAVGAFVYQGLTGRPLTIVTHRIPWGFYVANSTSCLGAGVGVLLLLTYRLRDDSLEAGLKVFLSMSAGVIFLLAGLLILADVSRMDRFYYMHLYEEVQPPFFRYFIILGTFLLLAVLFCLTSLRQAGPSTGPRSLSGSRAGRGIFCALPAPLGPKYYRLARWLLLGLLALLYLVTTELFSLRKVLLAGPNLFLSFASFIAALLTGLAVWVLLEEFYHQGRSGFDRSPLAHSARTGFLYLLSTDMMLSLIKYEMDRGPLLVGKVVTFFPSSPFVFLTVGNILPMILILIYKRQTRISRVAAPLLILVGLMMKRGEVLLPGYVERWLAVSPQGPGALTVSEIVILLGIYSLGILGIMGARRLVCRWASAPGGDLSGRRTEGRASG